MDRKQQKEIVKGKEKRKLACAICGKRRKENYEG